ncbi:MAG: hypothetical protein GTO02_09305 [Candidatus Dadabacteria bacterium]|nr:hypothetical protein [Candidatus Dadabacteria bacterium]
MKDQDFTNSLQYGKLYEEKAKEYFEYDEYVHPEGKISEYDIIFKKDNTEVKVEVKADRQAWKYGNLCIEIESNNIPSGLSITEADYWLHFIVSPTGDITEAYKIPVSELKKIAINYEYTKRPMGYNKLSRGLCIPKNAFKQYKL